MPHHRHTAIRDAIAKNHRLSLDGLPGAVFYGANKGETLCLSKK